MTSLLLFFFYMVPPSQAAQLELGIDRGELYLPVLKNKRVGLVVNQASLSQGDHTIDILRAKGVQIVKLFALEHGIRGDGGAGEEIGDGVDQISGIPIVSLYGKTFKPTPQMLADLDTVVFDIQDVGVRFYTYISSLGLILEAVAENEKSVIVLDRPNPNGDYVEGPLAKPGNLTFLGAYPIPVVYGLTIGELAHMIHGEGWKNTRGLDLQVIPMLNYDRSTILRPEGRPSSGLKSLNAIRAYPSLALFEPTIMSLGKGTDYPYEQFGIPNEPIGPHRFTPRPQWPGHKPLYEGQECVGEEFYTRPAEQIPHFTTDIFVSTMRKVRRRPFLTDKRFLQLLVGDNDVVEDILKGKSYAKIRPRFAAALARYEQRRQIYLLY